MKKEITSNSFEITYKDADLSKEDEYFSEFISEWQVYAKGEKIDYNNPEIYTYGFDYRNCSISGNIKWDTIQDNGIPYGIVIAEHQKEQTFDTIDIPKGSKETRTLPERKPIIMFSAQWK